MINLLPPQLKRERRLNNNLRIVFVAVSLILVVFIAASEGLGYFQNQNQKKLSFLETEIEAARKSAGEYEPIEQKINQTNEKLSKIETVNKNRPLWSVVLHELESTVPTMASINDLSFSLNGGSNSVALSGQAESRREIAKFKEKMESSTFFKNVYFSSSAYQSGQNNFSFSITGEMEKTK